MPLSGGKAAGTKTMTATQPERHSRRAQTNAADGLEAAERNEDEMNEGSAERSEAVPKWNGGAMSEAADRTKEAARDD